MSSCKNQNVDADAHLHLCVYQYAHQAHRDVHHRAHQVQENADDHPHHADRLQTANAKHCLTHRFYSAKDKPQSLTWI